MMWLSWTFAWVLATGVDASFCLNTRLSSGPFLIPWEWSLGHNPTANEGATLAPGVSLVLGQSQSAHMNSMDIQGMIKPWNTRVCPS